MTDVPARRLNALLPVRPLHTVLFCPLGIGIIKACGFYWPIVIMIVHYDLIRARRSKNIFVFVSFLSPPKCFGYFRNYFQRFYVWESFTVNKLWAYTVIVIVNNKEVFVLGS